MVKEANLAQALNLKDQHKLDTASSLYSRSSSSPCSYYSAVIWEPNKKKQEGTTGNLVLLNLDVNSVLPVCRHSKPSTLNLKPAHIPKP